MMYQGRVATHATISGLLATPAPLPTPAAPTAPVPPAPLHIYAALPTAPASLGPVQPLSLR